MNIHLIAVGKARSGPEKTLTDGYLKQCGWPSALSEVALKKTPANSDERKRLEADLLLNAVPAGARLVALDERGKALTSEALADRLGQWEDNGSRDVALVLGGADGLHKDVRARADLVLALGQLTWPHMLARAMVAEQLFRCWSIRTGHPYHRR
ncbi:23S rRNA (pseudouridine(1915)-N(3))-methyltransferase RlmH [Yunchengibacter salinarum]|uniref:23S rRNA (pseudouridine(1915)-N(3))-methyltransferase RlmH n=1 Tax=Yunchengibacter salinarum TaxID=3133399 RepID=UPI0035B694AA